MITNGKKYHISQQKYIPVKSDRDKTKLLSFV